MLRHGHEHPEVRPFTSHPPEDRIMVSSLSRHTAVLVLSGLSLMPTALSAGLTINSTDEGYWFREGDRPVLCYRAEPQETPDGRYRRAHYVHPLLGMDGEQLTDDFPADHLHHRGIFWGWHQVLVGRQPAGDSWTTEDFEYVIRSATIETQGEEAAVLLLQVDWTSPRIVGPAGTPQPFVTEETRITLHRSEENQQAVDFDIALRATRPDVQIGGAENEKQYSGFSLRLRRPEGVGIRDAAGALQEDAVMRSGLPWAVVDGQFAGGRGPSGIAVLSHPEFPASPQWHHLRHQGLQNVVFPGREPLDIPEHEPLRLRYRLLIHRGRMSAPDLERAHAAFLRRAGEPESRTDPAAESADAVGPTPLRLHWERNFLTISGEHLPGGEMKIHYLEAYCRDRSTDADWRMHTKVPHHTELLAAADDHTWLKLRCEVEDGLQVEHELRSTADEVDFQLVAHNPTGRRSEVHWAQPCIRVDRFTGRTQQTYLGKSFVFLDGELSRLPTRDWATEARYTPGQVWCPSHVDRRDVNPRPISPLVPSNGLIGCFSRDESMLFATAFEPYQELFQGVIVCLHADFRLGGLGPGETRKIRGKIYIVPNDVPALIERYARDFPEQAGAGDASERRDE
jgi:hypothetical protein